MAHDQETELARIIRSVECQPVLWKKHEVWSAVQERVAPKKKRFRLFRYAAALIAFMLVQVYTLKESPLISVTAPVQDQAITTIIDQSSNKSLADNHPTENITKDPKIQRRSLPPKTAPARIEKLVTTMTVEQIDHVHVEDSEVPNPAAIETIKIDNQSAASEDVIPEPRVKAIVGVIGWSDDNNTEARIRRKKLFQSPEPPEMVYDERPIPSMVIARLK
jgi:hypothetical protein